MNPHKRINKVLGSIELETRKEMYEITPPLQGLLLSMGLRSFNITDTISGLYTLKPQRARFMHQPKGLAVSADVTMSRYGSRKVEESGVFVDFPADEYQPWEGNRAVAKALIMLVEGENQGDVIEQALAKNLDLFQSIAKVYHAE